MKKTIYTAMLLTISSIAQAQAQFQEVANTPFENVETGSVAFADVDGDNDQDVLITGKNNGQRIANLYKNDGSGNYTLVTGTPFEGVMFSSVAFADVDGDNDQDVIIAGEKSDGSFITYLYTNDGSGNFNLVNFTPFYGVSKGDIAFSDIDNDGDQDVMIIGEKNNGNPSAYLYKNDGSGNYSEVLFTPFAGLMEGSVDFADVDNDGDQDVLITGVGNNNQKTAVIHTNDGNGSFSSFVNATQFVAVNESSAFFADIDGDNDQDVIITGLNGNYQKTANIYLNNGSGSFTAMLFPPFIAVNRGSISMADVDGDNDLDAFITGEDNNNNQTANLYTNSGNGNFTLETGMPFVPVAFNSIAFGDIDGDTYPELLITGLDSNNLASTKLYKNISNVGITKVDLETVNVYPNPASNILNIVINDKQQNTQITVTTIDGKIIYYNNNIPINFSIDVSNWNNGVYIVSVQTENTHKTMKLIKQ